MKLPEILNTGFKVDSPKLWRISIPVEEISIDELENNLDIPYLEKEGTDDWNLTPRMLIENLDAEVSHAKRLKEVDIAFPIDIYFHMNQWIILDGVHRFTRIYQLGQKTIKVRRVSREMALSVNRGGLN